MSFVRAVRHPAAITTLMLLLTTSCGASQQQSLTQPGGLSADPARLASAQVPPADQAVAGMRQFGYHLLRSEVSSDANAVISPLSLATAFAMVRAGARGETAAEIDDVFGFPTRGLAAAYDGLNRRLEADAVEIANGLFVQRGLPVGSEFLRTLANHYGAPAKTVDFSAGAEQLINDWVKKHTHGRIKKLFDALDPDTKLVLANAVYLKARWLHPFDRGDTLPGHFRRSDGSMVRTEMMSLTEKVRYASEVGWQAVELPYRDTDLAMLVLVPRAGGDPVRLLDPAILDDVERRLSVKEVGLELPRWDFQTDLPSLTERLAAMGMPSAFGPGADFSGISPLLYISEVAHRADITVGERGTEAAAATGIEMMIVSAPPTPKIQIDADHPFAFVIMDQATGVPVFEGVVGDPTVG